MFWLVDFFQTLGEITYNGHRLNEFVPQKTAAYISQNDVHIGEMTVKETLDFSARCQGVGSRYGTTATIKLNEHRIDFQLSCKGQ